MVNRVWRPLKLIFVHQDFLIIILWVSNRNDPKLWLKAIGLAYTTELEGSSSTFIWLKPIHESVDATETIIAIMSATIGWNFVKKVNINIWGDFLSCNHLYIIYKSGGTRCSEGRRDRNSWQTTRYSIPCFCVKFGRHPPLNFSVS